MKLNALILIALQTIASLAATNEPCYGGPDKIPGVCLSTSACKKDGGTVHKGGCLGNARGSGDDPGVQCCVKPTCKGGGACLWESDCGGKTTSKQCPGPAAFKCCDKPKSVFGTYDKPPLQTSKCQAVAEKGQKALLKQFKGRVKALSCYVNKPDSDHNTGKAVDFMISDDGGDATIGGLEIAEWVMRNRKVLNLKYVIWGQRIWSNDKGSKDKVEEWAKWRNLGDRNSITANHWDHVHVSFL